MEEKNEKKVNSSTIDQTKEVDTKNESSFASNPEGEWKHDFSVDHDKVVPNDVVVQDMMNVKQSEKVFLQDVDQKVKEQKSSKGRMISAVFTVLNLMILCLVLLYLSQNMGVTELSQIFTNVQQSKWLWWAIAIAILSILVETAKTVLLLVRTTKTFRPFVSYKSTAIEKFYDAVTPFSIGGQPFQIAYLHHYGVKAGVATSIPLAKTMMNMLSFVIISIIMLLTHLSLVNASSVFVIVLATISLVVITVLVAMIFTLSVSKKIAPKIIITILKVLAKLHLIKDYQTAFTRIMKEVLEYQKSILYYAKSPLTMTILVILSVGQWIIKASIPFVIYVAFTTNPTTGYFVIFTNFILCELASKIIPFPGGAGIAEISFSALFASLFSDGTLFWAVLLWRILTFYIYLVQGGLVILYDTVWGKKRNRSYKEKRKEIEEKMK